MLEDSGLEVRKAAVRGARSATSSRQLQDDAVTYTVERWEEAVLRSKCVCRPSAWAYRTAANAVRRMAKDLRRFANEVELPSWNLVVEPSTDVVDADPGFTPNTGDACWRRALRARLSANKMCLRGRQREIVLKMAEVGMSFHRAAKELAMPRFNVRRTFRSALRRLLAGR